MLFVWRKSPITRDVEYQGGAQGTEIDPIELAVFPAWGVGLTDEFDILTPSITIGQANVMKVRILTFSSIQIFRFIASSHVCTFRCVSWNQVLQRTQDNGPRQIYIISISISSLSRPIGPRSAPKISNAQNVHSILLDLRECKHSNLLPEVAILPILPCSTTGSVPGPTFCIPHKVTFSALTLEIVFCSLLLISFAPLV